MSESNQHEEKEHVLVCVSPSPFSLKTIRTAADLAMGGHARMSALYVDTDSRYRRISQKERQDLEWNLAQAQKEGAQIMFVHGKDIASQIAEFARKSKATCIVLGKTGGGRRGKKKKEDISLTLSKLLPDKQVYVVTHRMEERGARYSDNHMAKNICIDIAASCVMLILATLCSFWLDAWGVKDINLILVYIVGVLLTGMLTFYTLTCIAYSAAAVFAFNYFFTSPIMTFNVYDKSYLATFVIMFLTAFLTSFITHKMRNLARSSSRNAYRMELLLETSQKLQKAINKDDVMKKMSRQVAQLLEKNVLYYMGNPKDSQMEVYRYQKKPFRPLQKQDKEAACAAYRWNRHTGYSTDSYPSSGYLFLTVRNGEKIFAIVGIDMEQELLPSFEEGILVAMLSECALALEKEEFVIKQNEAFTKLKQEQLRANLLRSISHDLRTPLTSISGNASALIGNGSDMSEAQRIRLYQDIREDSMWLINLVENLLSVTRIENGSMQLHMQAEVVSDVIEEALTHVRLKKGQRLEYLDGDEILMARMDARLMIQVFMNLLSNAVKYAYDTSCIQITAYEQKEEVIVEVRDDGPGIRDEDKQHIFDMFFSAHRKVADGRRGMGLGLALCRSIVQAHGGSIEVKDNFPHGAVFCIHLKKEEVVLR